MLGFEKHVFCSKMKKLIFDPGKKGTHAAQTLFFTLNSHDFYTQKKCTFRVHFGSIWGPHVPKTLLFTMNFDDFRKVVFEYKNEQSGEKDCASWAKMTQSWPR